jgi:hypothetical protein
MGAIMAFKPSFNKHMAGLFCALVALIAVAQAESQTKPQFEAKTKAAEVSVTVEPELRKHPGLFEDLLAEGKRRAERLRAEAGKALRDEPDFFTEGRSWLFESNYSLRSVIAGRYVSVVRAESSYSGGAHGNLSIDTILWDGDARKRMSIRAFFRETTDNGPTMQALARLARLAVAAAKLDMMSDDEDAKKRKLTPEQYLAEDSQIADGIQPALLKIGPISLTPSTEPGKSAGLTFHYSPYAVGSYAEGPYTVVVPWTEFRQYLSPQGAAIFAGEQPANDNP